MGITADTKKGRSTKRLAWSGSFVENFSKIAFTFEKPMETNIWLSVCSGENLYAYCRGMLITPAEPAFLPCLRFMEAFLPPISSCCAIRWRAQWSAKSIMDLEGPGKYFRGLLHSQHFEPKWKNKKPLCPQQGRVAQEFPRHDDSSNACAYRLSFRSHLPMHPVCFKSKLPFFISASFAFTATFLDHVDILNSKLSRMLRLIC